MSLNIHNETGKLVSVILGIGQDMGEIPKIEECIDPKTRLNILNNTYPLEIDCIREIEKFHDILIKYNVKVLRPDNIANLNQIFTRDISFVVGDKIFIPDIIESRNREKDGIKCFLDTLEESEKIIIPQNIKIEGGDIIIHNDHIFIGYSDAYSELKVSRTSAKAIDFIREIFPKKNVIGLNLIKDDKDPNKSILHLDCAMQPIGEKKLIIYEEGFRNKEELYQLYDIFGERNLIKINQYEMFEGCSNVFSINPNTIVSDLTFDRLNNKLESLNFVVEKVHYREVSKFGGLFRCSTLPLNRI